MVAFFSMAVNSMEYFIQSTDPIARSMDAASRMFEILDTEASVKESDTPVSMSQLRGDIKVDNISFEYEVGRPVIKNVSFEVKAGQMIGLVGKTGADVYKRQDLFDPATDVHIHTNYTANTPYNKRFNKRELQREMGLPERNDIPLIGMVTRLTPQKGVNLLEPVSYTHLDVYKRQQLYCTQCNKSFKVVIT